MKETAMIDEAKVLKMWKNYKLKTCPDCGQTFAPTSGNKTRCDACAKKRIKAKQAEYYVHRQAAKLAKILAKSDRIREKNHPSNPDTGKKHPCPYCGKMTRTAYCASCHFQGFDNVHQMFGTTNGWDRKAAKRVPVVSGWCGRECVGFNSALSKRGE